MDRLLTSQEVLDLVEGRYKDLSHREAAKLLDVSHGLVQGVRNGSYYKDIDRPVWVSPKAKRIAERKGKQ